MKAKKQVQRQLKREYRRYKRRINGLLGDYSGTVEVPNRPGYVFVRMRNQEVKEAFNKKVPNLVDLPVVVGYADDPREPQILQVLDTQTGVERQRGEEPIGLFLPPHHETHEWLNPLGGNDVVFSDKRQFMPFRPTPIGGMLLHVYRNVGWLNGEYTYFSGSSIDLSPYVPATGAYLGLVYEDTDATLAFSTGTGDFLKDGFTLTLADIPDPIPGTYPIAAVRLWGGMTGIVEAADRTDLIDLRFPFTQNFLLLSDAPHSYTGSGGLGVFVKDDESGLEFAVGGAGGGQSSAITLFMTEDVAYVTGTFNLDTVVGAKESIDINGINVSGTSAGSWISQEGALSFVNSGQYSIHFHAFRERSSGGPSCGLYDARVGIRVNKRNSNGSHTLIQTLYQGLTDSEYTSRFGETGYTLTGTFSSSLSFADDEGLLLEFFIDPVQTSACAPSCANICENPDVTIYMEGTTESGITLPVITAGSPGHIIQDEGIDLAQQNRLNFVGGGVAAVNDPANGRTTVRIPGTVSVFDDGVFQVSGTALDFMDNLDVAVTGTHVFISGQAGGNGGGGGSTDLVIYDDSVFQVTGSAISFDNNLDVSVTGSVAFVSGGGDASSTIINISDYGAVPDAIAKSDGAMTSGSGVLTSASGEFTADDVGKTIFVGDGAGGSSLPLVTTIQSFTSATEVTLAANAGATVSNAYYIYGTDNTQAFQDALDAAYVIAVDVGKATVQCAAGTYLVGTAVGLGDNGEYAQIRWPFADTSDEAVNIELIGATRASIPRIHWQETGKQGTVIQSTIISQTYSSSTGTSSVIGGPASYGPQHGTSWTGFNYVGMIIRDLTIRQVDNPWLTGIDGGWMHNFVIERVQMDTITTGLAATVPSHPASIGVQFPIVNFRGPGIARDVTVKGYYCAFGGGELLNGDRLEGILCNMLFALTPSFHANRLGFLEDINCIHGFGGLDPSTGIIDVPTSLAWLPGTPGFAGAANIALWSVQDNNGQVSGFNRVNHIKDANSVAKLAGMYTLVTAGGTRQTTGLTFTGDIKYPLVDLFTAPHGIVSIYLNVSDFELLFGSVAKGIQNGFPIWLFDAASIETIGTSVAMPSHWNTYAIYIHWTNNGAGSGNVVWRHDRKSATDGLSFTAGATTGTPLTVSAPVAGTLKRTLLETGIARSGTIQAIQLARIGSDGADTLGNDASILGVLLVKIT